MLNEFIRSFRLMGLSIAVCVVAYTALILATASVVAPEKRLGSLLYGSDGQVIGSRLVAQPFTRPEYLWPRPSAVDYNASGAGGSNLSPTNPKIRERADAILANYKLKDGATLPADLATASGSGLDPHISLAAALIQADRIAMSRQVEVSTIQELLQRQAASRSVPTTDSEGLVNVLEFNLLLDSQLKSVESL
ncbi:MAG: potassium-transporting ATPase subunit C [Planctomycetales bacterium]|nr:potassium-transporting ATPase subunit C [Planctomycetales bacterium]